MESTEEKSQSIKDRVSVEDANHPEVEYDNYETVESTGRFLFYLADGTIVAEARLKSPIQ